MDIIYAYSNCTDRKYHELFADNRKLVLRADQKYHSLLIKRLVENDVQINALSSLPINREVTKKILINEQDEVEGNATFHYYNTINLPILRQLTVFCAGFFNVLKAKKKDTVLICDYQNLANAYGVLLAGKIKGIPSSVIVMDLPGFLSGNGFVQKMYGGTFKLADSFILLTEQMNKPVNPKNKPHIVVEGIADSTISVTNSSEYFEEDLGKKIVLYAGSLAEIYGIKNLVDGFLNAEIDNAELWIYGDGDYRKKLQNICKEHNEVKYKGVCSNEEIVRIEQKVALLVNPRPSDPSYTKYSFPSKTMEYMASGTPVLSTRLPGIPDEYFTYIYSIDREDSDGIADALRTVLDKSMEERLAKGRNARDFVLVNKSNLVQAKRIIDFIEKEFAHGKK